MALLVSAETFGSVKGPDIGSNPVWRHLLSENAEAQGVAKSLTGRENFVATKLVRIPQFSEFIYGGCRIVVSTEACGASGAGSIPVNHPNLSHTVRKH